MIMVENGFTASNPGRFQAVPAGGVIAPQGVNAVARADDSAMNLGTNAPANPLAASRRNKIPTSAAVIRMPAVTASVELSEDDGANPADQELDAHCMSGDTLVATIDGPKAARDLTVGDLVLTLDHGYRPIRWTHRRSGSTTETIRIAAGAYGCDRDTFVGPDQYILVQDDIARGLFDESEVLVQARDLVDGKAVIAETDAGIDRVQVLFDEHQIIFADGVRVGSLHAARDKLSTLTPATRMGILAALPAGRAQTAARSVLDPIEVDRFISKVRAA